MEDMSAENTQIKAQRKKDGKYEKEHVCLIRITKTEDSIS